VTLIDNAQTPLVSAADPLPTSGFQDTPLIPTAVESNLLISTLLDKGAVERHIRSFALALGCITPIVTPLAVRGSVGNFLISTLSVLADVINQRQSVTPLHLSVDPEENSSNRKNAERALSAVEDLVQWLGRTEEQIADLAGFARRNIPNWRSGSGVYPKTVRSLFEIHAVVGGLVRNLGIEGANHWLAQMSESGIMYRQLLASSDGRRALQRLAQPLVFSRTRFSGLVEDVEDDVSPDSAFSAPPEPQKFSQKPVRRRRRL
jgi:hypothetical protein